MTRGATHRFIPNPFIADGTGKISGTVVLDNPTGNEAALTLNYTTNKLTSGNDTGLVINMTDTASPGTSYIIDAKVGGTSVMNLSLTGALVLQNTITVVNSITCNNFYNNPGGQRNSLVLQANSTDFGDIYLISKLTGGGKGFVVQTQNTVPANVERLSITGGDTTATLLISNSIVGIGGAPNTNAILDVSSTTKAFMPPRMTTTQRDAIATPTEGMIIFNITTHVLNFYSGAAWTAV